MIDQREHTGGFCFFSHPRGLDCVQRHRLFTENCLPLFESGTDTGAPSDSGAPADGSADDTSTPGDSAITDTGTPPGDAIFSDIMSTKDTEVDAIFLEAGGGDTTPDTLLPDAFTLFDTAIDDADADAR